jgi:hypothetical protein
VASDDDIARGFAHLKTRWDAFDILVHAVAFAPREALTGTFIDATTRDGFRVAHDISSYSLTALARESLPFMKGHAGAIVTLSYLGAMRSLPGYNVMGLAKASLDQDAVRGVHSRVAQNAGARGVRVADQAQCHHRGRRQYGRVPVLRFGGRHYRGSHLRGRGLQFRGHEFSGGAGGALSRGRRTIAPALA